MSLLPATPPKSLPWAFGVDSTANKIGSLRSFIPCVVQPGPFAISNVGCVSMAKVDVCAATGTLKKHRSCAGSNVKLGTSTSLSSCWCDKSQAVGGYT